MNWNAAHHEAHEMRELDAYLEEGEGENNNPTPLYRHPVTGRFITRRQLYSFNLTRAREAA